jgi:hypothetical protein
VNGQKTDTDGNEQIKSLSVSVRSIRLCPYLTLLVLARDEIANAIRRQPASPERTSEHDAKKSRRSNVSGGSFSYK